MSPTSDPDSTQVASSSSGAPAPPRRRRGSDGSKAPAAPTDDLALPPSVFTDDTSATPSQAAAPAPAPATRSRRQRRTGAAAAPAAATEAVVADLEDDEPVERAPRRKAKQKASRPAPAPRPNAPRAERRFRQQLVKVDLWSVTKLSLCFFISAMFVTIVAMIALWLIADAAGIIKSVEEFLGDLLSAQDFQFLSGEVLRGTILIGLVIVALQVVITVIAASFYNIFAELFGGLEITIKEEDSPPRS
jgi:hypothetical protein